MGQPDSYLSSPDNGHPNLDNPSPSPCAPLSPPMGQPDNSAAGKRATSGSYESAAKKSKSNKQMVSSSSSSNQKDRVDFIQRYRKKTFCGECKPKLCERISSIGETVTVKQQWATILGLAFDNGLQDEIERYVKTPEHKHVQFFRQKKVGDKIFLYADGLTREELMKILESHTFEPSRQQPGIPGPNQQPGTSTPHQQDFFSANLQPVNSPPILQPTQTSTTTSSHKKKKIKIHTKNGEVMTLLITDYKRFSKQINDNILPKPFQIVAKHRGTKDQPGAIRYITDEATLQEYFQVSEKPRLVFTVSPVYSQTQAQMERVPIPNNPTPGGSSNNNNFDGSNNNHYANNINTNNINYPTYHYNANNNNFQNFATITFHPSNDVIYLDDSSLQNLGEILFCVYKSPESETTAQHAESPNIESILYKDGNLNIWFEDLIAPSASGGAWLGRGASVEDDIALRGMGLESLSLEDTPAKDTGATPASVHIEATPASTHTEATPASLHTGATLASAHTETTPASVRTETTPASARTEDTPGSVHTGATLASARTETTPVSARTEDTPRSVLTEGTPASGLTESTPASMHRALLEKIEARKDFPQLLKEGSVLTDREILQRLLNGPTEVANVMEGIAATVGALQKEVEYYQSLLAISIDAKIKNLVPLILPSIFDPNFKLNFVTPQTVIDLVDGKYFGEFHIIDCRTKDEFDAGHIKTAMQVVTIHIPNGTNIFYCDSTDQSNPRSCDLVKSLSINLKHGQPNRELPPMFVLEGGFKNFSEKFKDYCVGRYVEKNEEKDEGPTFFSNMTKLAAMISNLPAKK
eukprot:Phypoly_transcript_02832.p1 GENE.Phypoly_transcript_02832~~Phypoly_transcript_02832.p1  ORF type:complete len:851 (+),score=154.85 Phypoly_transcript_02832:113-2554(+)